MWARDKLPENVKILNQEAEAFLIKTPLNHVSRHTKVPNFFSSYKLIK